MIELTTALFVMLSSVYGLGVATSTIDSSVIATTSPETLVQVTPINQPRLLEDQVREYFKDYPVLAEIAKCESTFRHFKANGDVVRGKVNKSDVGVMQINEYYHDEKAVELGFDLHTLEGNVAYAKYLYEKEGTRPWNSSSKCWKKAASALSGNKLIATTK